jgi:ABC-type polar amino acid transport system ATPase subunit
MIALDVSGLRKSYDATPVFDDVSLQLQRAEAVALTGPSGAGKTTLLRCLNGLELADAGVISVGGARIVAGERPEQLQAAIHAVRLRVGFVFQGCHLFSHRSVLENVMEGPLFVKRE